MTKLIRYSLSERDVRLWKLRKENPPFKRTDLDRFLKQALKGATTQEKREKAVQEASENLIEKAKDLSGKIQENNVKELQLLKLDSRVRGLYNEIDSGWVPKQARQTITSGKGKPETIHSPSKEWLLLAGSFSPDQEVLILHVKELRDERSRLQNELSGIVQKLKVLTAKATTEGMTVRGRMIRRIFKEYPRILLVDCMSISE